MERPYQLASFFWLGFGIYVAFSAYRLGLGKLRQPGPGFIFFLAAGLLILLSLIDLGGILSGRERGGRTAAHREEPLWSGVKWPKVLLVLAGLSAYVLGFSRLGFLPSTFLLMIFLLQAVEPTKWWVSLLGSLLTLLISYGIFGLWLKVPFPPGILEF